MTFDMSKIDLNKPAFGKGAQTLDDMREQTEEEKETKEEVKEVKEIKENEESEEESKVPYSRFKKFHDRSKELEQRISELEAEKEQPESKREKKHYDEEEMDSAWKELYGDSEASQRAFRIDQQRREDMYEKLRNEAIEAVRNERGYEAKRVQENLSVIDEQLEILQDFVGRELTKKEEEAVLDIVDDYTPKDKDGNYHGATMPFEKAWEIYELKKNSTNAPKKHARDNVASLNNSRTQGEISNQEEKNKNFDPRNWNGWKDRI